MKMKPGCEGARVNKERKGEAMSYWLMKLMLSASHRRG